MGIRWEQQGESSHTCIEIFLTSLLRHSISGYLDLRHVTLFSDRGYWTPTLVYWLLSCGAFVVGTLIRALCIGAFRSGTDNISLAMSSKNHENEWDCILIDPRDF